MQTSTPTIFTVEHQPNTRTLDIRAKAALARRRFASSQHRGSGWPLVYYSDTVAATIDNRCVVIDVKRCELADEIHQADAIRSGCGVPHQVN
jgi:hypothetical protein